MKRDFALAAEYPQRVGMIIDRDNPPRLVHRFGYIMPERTLSLDADRYGSVLWDRVPASGVAGFIAIGVFR
jgi:hypothetical protein